MNSRCLAARVRVVCHPRIAFDMSLQNENVPTSRSDHSGCGRCPWKAQPVGCEIQTRHDPAENTYGRTATAERAGTTGRTTADGLTAIDIHVREFATVIPCGRSMWVRTNPLTTGLRRREVAGHGHIAFGYLSGAGRTGFRSDRPGYNKDRRNEDLFKHAGLRSERSCPAIRSQ